MLYPILRRVGYTMLYPMLWQGRGYTMLYPILRRVGYTMLYPILRREGVIPCYTPF